MKEIFPAIFEIFPSKPTPKKYRTFFVRREAGNLLIPCFSTKSTIEAHFGSIVEFGGISKQLLGDSHFKSTHCDEITQHFGASLYCSEIEVYDVISIVKNVISFPFERHSLDAGIEVIPTPGHRDGGVCYLITLNEARYLFVGDFIWHDGEQWIPTARKSTVQTYDESLQLLSSIEFDVLLANSIISNSICFVEIDNESRSDFIGNLRKQLPKK